MASRAARTARRTARRAAGLAAGLLLVATASGCGLFGGDDGDGESVFDAEVGQCFLAPEEVQAQIADLDRVGCGEPHEQELYARVAYQPPGAAPTGPDETPDESADQEPVAGDTDFPGDEALNAFAQASCAQEFSGYVGVDYLDSALFFTYLLPSPRSWQEDDRDVLCFVNAAGEPLQGTVRDSRR